MTVKTRIAPSPTGDPHVGTAYIALFNYCFAKSQGGKFILRIEDTDQTRSHPRYEKAIMDALRWLDIGWDEGPDVGGPSGPYRQSERKGLYEEHAAMLLENGSAYRCFCTPERLEEMRQRLRAEGSPTTGYDGHCRKLTAQEVQAKMDQGLANVVRLKMPTEGDVGFMDRLRGEVKYPAYQIDDQVLLKSDGFPTYHLANVVDDHLMGITHVIRAEEWLASTPKHVRLYEAFGWELPEFIHMPLLRNLDKSKISKRKNPTSIAYYERIGILPEAMRNFLGLMGYSFGDDVEKFTRDEMVENFDIGRVSLGGPVFDVAKLNHVNGLYLRELDVEDLTDRIMTGQFSRQFISRIVPLLQERMERLDQFVEKAEFFFGSELEYDSSLLIGKKMTVDGMVTAFNELTDELDNLLDWTPENIEHTLRTYCETAGVKPRGLFMPVRIAVTGRKASPGLFESMEVVGKPLTQARMRQAILRLRKLKKELPESA